QAGDIAVHLVSGPLVGDDTVDGDAATDRRPIALRAQIGIERGVLGGQRVRPRQHSVLDLLRLRVLVQVVDGGDGSGRAVHLEQDVFRVEAGVLQRFGAWPRDHIVGAEYAV